MAFTARFYVIVAVLLAALGLGAAFLLKGSGEQTPSASSASPPGQATAATTVMTAPVTTTPAPKKLAPVINDPSASYMKPWKPGQPDARILGEQFQPLVLAHRPANAANVFWFGPRLGPLVPYIRADGSKRKTELAKVLYSSRATVLQTAVTIDVYPYLTKAQMLAKIAKLKNGNFDAPDDLANGNTLWFSTRKQARKAVPAGTFVLADGGRSAIVFVAGGRVVKIEVVAFGGAPKSPSAASLAAKLTPFSR